MSFNSVHGFNVELAIQYGVHEAILIAHFQYWINKNKKLGINIKDGRTWTYQTREDIAAHFPYFTCKQVRTITDNLVKKGVLIKGKYNQKGFDKTIWYAFINENMFTSAQMGNGSAQMGNAGDQKGKPIPDTKPGTNPDTKEFMDAESLNSAKSQKGKKSNYKGFAKLKPEQKETLAFLKSLNIDTDDDTLSWWATQYSKQRLQDVFDEAVHRDADSIGKYMHKLLKEKSVVTTGKVRENREYATQFAEAHKWSALQIFQKYARVDKDELSFCVDSYNFIDQLHAAYDKFHANKNRG